MIKHISRNTLFEMTTTGLYALDHEASLLKSRIKAELILRGDY